MGHPFPAHRDGREAVSEETVDGLADFLRRHRVTVLAGAGCSTESGIPDYRGPETHKRHRTPIQYREFVRSAAARQRYWARAVIGWPSIRSARPNAAHRALADLERTGHVAGVITQNVDRLHQAAGTRRIVELHGALADVRCLDCGARTSRDAVQRRMLARNPGWIDETVETAPDGDAELATETVQRFRVTGCDRCAGALKPDVVFFGENVPRPRLQEAWRLFDEGDALLVVGSSLAVFSGYRFVRAAERRGRAVAILNVGATRGDHAASLHVEAPAGEVLPRLVATLRGRTDQPAA